MIPPGPELAARNRPLLAERLRWPPGSVLVCEYLDHQHPGWHTDWMHANEWAKRPAGWYAQHTCRAPDAYGATPDELRAAIRTHRCPEILATGLWGT